MLALPGMEDLCWHDLAERSVLLAAARMLWACDSFFANRVQVEDIIVSADPETVHHHSAAGSPKMFLLQIKVGRSRADTSLRRLLDAKGIRGSMGLDFYNFYESWISR